MVKRCSSEISIQELFINQSLSFSVVQMETSNDRGYQGIYLGEIVPGFQGGDLMV